MQNRVRQTRFIAQPIKSVWPITVDVIINEIVQAEKMKLDVVSIKLSYNH